MTSTGTVLRAQWSELRRWLDTVRILEHADLPSGLPAWSVRDLVAHLGVGLAVVSEVPPASPGTPAVRVGDYLSRYQPAAPAIAASTREFAATTADLMASLDAIAAQAWCSIDAWRAPVVLGRRGPLRVDDLLLTRVVELVVHGDDLHRAVPVSTPSPVLPAAHALVHDTLAATYRSRSGAAPPREDPGRWLREATGRLPTDDPHLPLL